MTTPRHLRFAFVAQPAAPEMSRLRYTNSAPMTATTIDLLWTGRPRSIAAVPQNPGG
jgi:hypothetical protein